MTVSKQVSSIRKAMRRSYEKHHRLALKDRLGPADQPAHRTALYGALGTRNQLSGFSANEFDIWLELVPFLEIEQEEGIAALCEYAAWREMVGAVHSVDVQYLQGRINKGILGQAQKRSPLLAAAIQQEPGPPWLALLTPDTANAAAKWYE